MLFRACECGDLAEVKSIIETNQKAGDAWNTVESGFNKSEILIAPNQSHTKSNGSEGVEPKPSIKWLVDAQCDTHWTPIMFAARYGHLAIVKYLASLDARLENNTTYNPLHAACFGHSTNVVKFLIHDMKCDVNP